MIEIKEEKINSTKKIEEYLKPQTIYLPVEVNGITYNHHVKEGDYVYKADIIATSNEGFPLHSPISGYVYGGTKKMINSGQIVKCIVIENDFKEKYRQRLGTKQKITNLTKEEFVTKLKNSGIVGLSGNGFPTYKKYTANIRYLIVNGVECEPYNSCDNAIMYQNAEEILEAIDAIMEINKIEKAYIGVNENNTKIIDNFLKYINTYPNIKVYSIPNYYPSGWERNLVKTIFNVEYEKYPTEKNILVENVQTVKAIYEMLKYSHPLIERIITINGDGIKKPSNVKVKIGTMINEVIQNTSSYKKKVDNHLFVANGLLNGTSLPSDEIVVTKDLTSIVVLTNVDEKVYPCIKCGKCIKHCPAKIKPVIIMNNLKNKTYLQKLHPEKCIGCGLCSYICPSRVEVKEFVKKARDLLW